MPHVLNETAPKEWRGRFFEDMEVGDVYRSRLAGRWSKPTTPGSRCSPTTPTRCTSTTSSLRLRSSGDRWSTRASPSIVVGLSVADTSENAVANLSWDSISMPRPVFAGDTLWAESEVLSKRGSVFRPSQGIIGIRTRGINQRGETVVEFLRTFMMYRRTAPQAASHFPEPVMHWIARR